MLFASSAVSAPSLFQPPIEQLPAVPDSPPLSPSSTRLPPAFMTKEVTHYEIGTPIPDTRSRHHCCVCRTKFVPGEDICRLYDDHCFHEACLEEKLTREVYDDPWQESDQTTITTASSTPLGRHRNPSLAGTGIGESETPKRIQLSSHTRDYAAYPIQTRLTDGRPSICLLYTSPSPRDLSTSRMPSSA